VNRSGWSAAALIALTWTLCLVFAGLSYLPNSGPLRQETGLVQGLETTGNPPEHYLTIFSENGPGGALRLRLSDAQAQALSGLDRSTARRVRVAYYPADGQAAEVTLLDGPATGRTAAYREPAGSGRETEVRLAALLAAAGLAVTAPFLSRLGWGDKKASP
jgi:hypothetical protein